VKKLWRLWALSLGEKAGRHDREADAVAVIRTIILISYLITNIAIVANAWRHWNNVECIPQATKKGGLKAPSL